MADRFREGQRRDVVGHDEIHRCRLCPLRVSNEQPVIASGLDRVKQTVWPHCLAGEAVAFILGFYNWAVSVNKAQWVLISFRKFM